MIALQGFTAEQRSCLKFDWVNNLQYRYKENTYVTKHFEDVSSLFAIFWNLMKKKAHPEVLDDIESYLMVHDIKRMAYNSQEGYSVTVEDEELNFPFEKNAPPLRAIATNFSRHMHTEKNGSRFTTFWNLSCSHGPEVGANLFFTSYGI